MHSRSIGEPSSAVHLGLPREHDHRRKPHHGESGRGENDAGLSWIGSAYDACHGGPEHSTPAAGAGSRTDPKVRPAGASHGAAVPGAERAAGPASAGNVIGFSMASFSGGAAGDLEFPDGRRAIYQCTLDRLLHHLVSERRHDTDQYEESENNVTKLGQYAATEKKWTSHPCDEGLRKDHACKTEEEQKELPGPLSNIATQIRV